MAASPPSLRRSDGVTGDATDSRSRVPGSGLTKLFLRSARAGMGEVYRASDTRLDRAVAIKVLPSHLSDNPDARARFQREAKAISGLSHPHICTLHDVGHHDGVDFLVMELLEGRTLADRLDSGPLPLEQVFRIGVEIADALDRAHRAGVVHRDLKPGNVMLTKSGVKLLDFGLARIAPVKPATSGLSVLPTEAAPSRPLTEKGTVLGTVQYMAPEQLEGKDADARTDIFALGCILYEMATGKKAFSGGSQASLITAIMSGDPAPISTLAPMTPPAFDRLVRICLAKDPDERWQSAHDVKSELQWIAQAGSQAGLPAVVVTRRKSRERLAWMAAVIVAAGAAALVSRVVPRRAPAAEAVRFDIAPPAGAFGTVALSPDGRKVAYDAPDASGASKIWIRALDSVEPRAIGGTGEAGDDLSLAWSPDGRSLLFATGREIRRIEIAGGTAATGLFQPDHVRACLGRVRRRSLHAVLWKRSLDGPDHRWKSGRGHDGGSRRRRGRASLAAVPPGWPPVPVLRPDESGARNASGLGSGGIARRQRDPAHRCGRRVRRRLPGLSPVDDGRVILRAAIRRADAGPLGGTRDDSRPLDGRGERRLGECRRRWREPDLPV